MFRLETRYGSYDARVEIARYSNGRLALCAVTPRGEPLMKMSHNVPDIALDDGDVILKTWSENEGIFESLLAQGIVIDTGRRIPVAGVLAPVVQLAA